MSANKSPQTYRSQFCNESFSPRVEFYPSVLLNNKFLTYCFHFSHDGLRIQFNYTTRDNTSDIKIFLCWETTYCQRLFPPLSLSS